MHEKEVGGVGLLTDLLGNTRCHRNRGNASGTDKRVDLSAGEEVHQLAQQNAACSTYAERDTDLLPGVNERAGGVQVG